MEYKFKLTVDEYTTVFKVIETLGGGRAWMVKLMKRVILFTYVGMSLAFLIFQGFKSFIAFGIVAGIILIVFFISLSPSFLDRKRSKVVANMLKNKPGLLEEQIVKFKEDHVIYSYTNVTVKTYYKDISKVVVEKDVIMALGPNIEQYVVIPCSIFVDSSEKNKVINLLNSK
ncbi:hypothetical protein [Faecalimicrobium sp. JNUCC 81]